MSSQPGLRRGCAAAGAKGRSWGLWSRPTDMTETAAGSSAEVSERTPLPPSSWDEASADGVPGARPFLCCKRAAGRAGRAAGGTAGRRSRYLFSMFCICKLREVKLASRSVTSSTCGGNQGSVMGCPGSPPTAPQAQRQARSLLPGPVRASPWTMEQLSKGESSLTQREGPRPLPRRWREALRPTEDGNQQPCLSLQPQSGDRLALRLLPGPGLDRSCAHLLAGARLLEAGAEVI